MKRLDSLEDDMRGTVTYEPPNGRFARFDVRTVREYGLAACMREYGIEVPTERVPVTHHGRRVGTLPGDFDPICLKSTNFLYEPRSGDFKRDGDIWVASRTLGPGDLDAVAGFQRDDQQRASGSEDGGKK